MLRKNGLLISKTRLAKCVALLIVNSMKGLVAQVVTERLQIKTGNINLYCLVPSSWRRAGELKKCNLHQPHPGAQCHHYRCFLPDLAEFAANCREGTDASYRRDYPDFMPSFQLIFIILFQI